MLDFILNGSPSGSVATALLATGGDVGIMRPFVENGRAWYNRFDPDKGKEVVLPYTVTNGAAVLTRDDWIHFDREVMEAARPKMRFVADLQAAGLNYNVPNGMSKTVLQYYRMSETTPATTSMSGLKRGTNDAPVADFVNLPLPIIHKDFRVDSRMLLVSKNGGMPLDTTNLRLAAARVGEEIERLHLGTAASFSFGGGTVYGARNFPGRITGSITIPTTGGWVPRTAVTQILAAIQSARNEFHGGPYLVYFSPAWEQYLEDDYVPGTSNSTDTLRDRLSRHGAVSSISIADFLPAWDVLIIEKTPETMRVVTGMEIQTLQWSEQGGMDLYWKVMAIKVPQVREDIYGATGVIHLTGT